MLAKYQNVFRSRWKALWWAAGVCLTAYCSVPSPSHHTAAKSHVASADSSAQDDDSAQDAAAINSAMNGIGWGGDSSGASHQSDKHTNPWAITPKH
ncbi:hypothetical protein GRI58_14875 [Porphyrobacter algicida]|uniref:Uncharacterized protein n=1 Tax=Qipengyuania algicida TaxID=1836209 RepID=A0A845AIK2_9SPHN|nr:hypothetical protein [Qipengyuania algicida]MXP30090.1 hypothetical protein [Qipengyuania algicida]